MKFKRDFFYDEVRNGFYIPAIMKKAWGAEMLILSEIDRICKKHGIAYYLGGGTLLGAVRDATFIPWDDDVDIMMFREDYEAFRRIAKEELPEELEFLSIEEDSSFRGMNAVVCSNEKRFNEDCFKKYHGYPFSAFVDIFALDAISDWQDKEKIRRAFLSLLYKIREENWKTGTCSEESLQALRDTEAYYSISSARESSLEGRVGLLIEKVYQFFNGEESSRVASIPFYFLNNASYPRDAFHRVQYLSFCGAEFPTASNWESLLTSDYGDYRRVVKDGGEHNYPYFKEQEKNIEKELGEDWVFHYHITNEDLCRPEIESFRDAILHAVEILYEVTREAQQFDEKRKKEEVDARLSMLQEMALSIGNRMERKYGEGKQTVSILEEYCELLYRLHVVEQDEKEGAEKETLFKTLFHLLENLREVVEKDARREIVFLPHSVQAFSSIRPLVDAFLREEGIEVKIIPIPYYDVLGDGSFSEPHYEGSDFPEGYTITDYTKYPFAEELPDSIVLCSPYDAFNASWTVDPFFYSKNMQRFTTKLIYIPWFVTDEIDPKNPEDGKAFYNMRYYVTVPGVFHADYTLVQSEGMKAAYLEKISEFLKQETEHKNKQSSPKEVPFSEKRIEEGMQVMRKKILGAGSCLFGEKEGQGTKEVVEALRKILEEEKGNRTKKRSDKER